MNKVPNKLTIAFVVILLVALGYVGFKTFENRNVSGDLALVSGSNLPPVSSWRTNWNPDWDTPNPNVPGVAGSIILNTFFKCNVGIRCADGTLKPDIQITYPTPDTTLTLNHEPLDKRVSKFEVRIADVERSASSTYTSASLGQAVIFGPDGPITTNSIEENNGNIQVLLIGRNFVQNIVDPLYHQPAYSKYLSYNYVRNNGIRVMIPLGVRSGTYKLRVVVQGIGHSLDSSGARRGHTAIGETTFNIDNNVPELPTPFVKVLSPDKTTQALLQDINARNPNWGVDHSTFSIRANWTKNDFPSEPKYGSKWSASLIVESAIGKNKGDEISLIKDRPLSSCAPIKTNDFSAILGWCRNGPKGPAAFSIMAPEEYVGITIPYKSSIKEGRYRLKMTLKNRDGLTVSDTGEVFGLTYPFVWDRLNKAFMNGQPLPNIWAVSHEVQVRDANSVIIDNYNYGNGATNNNVTPPTPPIPPAPPEPTLTITSPNASTSVAVGGLIRVKAGNHAGLTNSDKVNVYLRKEGSNVPILIGTSATTQAGTTTPAQACPTDGAACNSLLTGPGLIRRIPNSVTSFGGIWSGMYRVRVVVTRGTSTVPRAEAESALFEIR